MGGLKTSRLTEQITCDNVGKNEKRGLGRGGEGGAGSVFSDATGGRIDLLEGSAPILPSGAFPFK